MVEGARGRPRVGPEGGFVRQDGEDETVSESEAKHPGGGPLRPVEVRIGGKAYRLRGQDPALLARLAGKVDTTLRRIGETDESGQDYKVAVLAALNLAAEAEERDRHVHETAGRLRQRARRLEQRLETLSRRLSDPE